MVFNGFSPLAWKWNGYIPVYVQLWIWDAAGEIVNVQLAVGEQATNLTEVSESCNKCPS